MLLGYCRKYLNVVFLQFGYYKKYLNVGLLPLRCYRQYLNAVFFLLRYYREEYCINISNVIQFVSVKRCGFSIFWYSQSYLKKKTSIYSNYALHELIAKWLD